MGGSLFERLTLGKRADELTEDESIRLNLSRVFGTRQGAVQALPFFGLPDLNDLTRSKSEIMTEACNSIAENIRRYEPRLTQPKVTALPTLHDSPFTMNFLIEAQKITSDGKRIPWSWEMSTDGYRMRGR